MGQTTLVGNWIEDGQEIVSRLAQEGFDVTTAFWAKTSEEGLWFLYIASRVVDDQGLAAAYRRLNAAVRHMPDLWVSPFDIKLIGADNPITKDVLHTLRDRRSKIPTPYGGARLGGVAIDEAYLYPLPEGNSRPA